MRGSRQYSAIALFVLRKKWEKRHRLLRRTFLFYCIANSTAIKTLTKTLGRNWRGDCNSLIICLAIVLCLAFRDGGSLVYRRAIVIRLAFCDCGLLVFHPMIANRPAFRDT